jgi:uncharacterized protein involved in exopolysaccharide biosynthesis
VIDAAVSPDRKSFPRLTIIGPAATLSWLLLAILWIFFRQAFASGQNKPEERARLQVLKAAWKKNFFK